MAQPGGSNQDPQEAWNKTTNNLKLSDFEVSENEKCSWLQKFFSFYKIPMISKLLDTVK